LEALDWVTLGLVVVLVAGYIGINFEADLPRFLIAENIGLAILYLVWVAAVLGGARWAYPYLLFISSFNAGRVSRSVVTPEGKPAELAREHIPLLALVLAVALLALYSTLSRR